jgi:hypothetical protein
MKKYIDSIFDIHVQETQELDDGVAWDDPEKSIVNTYKKSLRNIAKELRKGIEDQFPLKSITLSVKERTAKDKFYISLCAESDSLSFEQSEWSKFVDYLRAKFTGLPDMLNQLSDSTSDSPIQIRTRDQQQGELEFTGENILVVEDFEKSKILEQLIDVARSIESPKIKIGQSSYDIQSIPVEEFTETDGEDVIVSIQISGICTRKQEVNVLAISEKILFGGITKRVKYKEDLFEALCDIIKTYSIAKIRFSTKLRDGNETKAVLHAVEEILEINGNDTLRQSPRLFD